METSRRLIYDLDLPELEQAFLTANEPVYRAKQVWQGLYQQLWNQPAQFTNLPKALREWLAEIFIFQNLTPDQVLYSTDRETRKTLFLLPDERAIEAVLMHYDRRKTLCISTQAGCAMGCVFCATGQMGFKRHLTSG
ncbi:MAG TPA: 23S rRNA (adenine(2503)-C2)-methyltransferase, partial [Anaerolineaceae bacterium]|nr:23S rRNA (adenine(2503)-C2)-methyltransferase [Anaerolineaceae bacterium]